MGQYFIVVNETKKEYLVPHDFGDGLKLMEFGASGGGTMTALTLLLRQSESAEGIGGDYHGDPTNRMLGRWAGDQIAVIGDYCPSGMYEEAHDSYENVSIETVLMMAEDPFLKQDLKERMKWRLQVYPPQQRKVLLKALGLPEGSV